MNRFPSRVKWPKPQPACYECGGGDDPRAVCPSCVELLEAAQEVSRIHGAFAFVSDETQQRMLARLREIQVQYPELDAEVSRG